MPSTARFLPTGTHHDGRVGSDQQTEYERVSDSLREALAGSTARSCLVAPLSRADTVFGALAVHAPSADAFSDREATAFETHLSERLGCTVTVGGVVPTEDGPLLEYATVEGTPVDAVHESLGGTTAIGETRVLADDGDRCSLECAVRAGEAGLRVIAEHGASLRTARAVDGTGKLTARFPTAHSARDAVADIGKRFDGAELLAKRVRDVEDVQFVASCHVVVEGDRPALGRRGRVGYRREGRERFQDIGDLGVCHGGR